MRSRAEANSQAAADYAKKKKEQLERANRLRLERDAQAISRPNSISHHAESKNQQLLVMSDALEQPTVNERIKISKQDYQFIDQKTLEQQAKAKHNRDLELFHQMKISSKTDTNSKVAASSIISGTYLLSKFRNINVPEVDGSLFFNHPRDETGHLIDVSDRPLLCISSNSRNEVVVGSADHALYAFDINVPNRSPVKMYSKTAGHTDWITGVAHLPDGRVISSSMDGKLCLWETNKRSCIDLFGHQGSITKVLFYFLKMSLMLIQVLADTSNNVAVSIGYDGKILIWALSQAQSGPQRRSGHRQSPAITPAATLDGHKSPILECTFHDNGGTRGVLASGDREGKVIIWEVESSAMIARYKGHNGSITAMDTVQNGNDNKTYFVTGGSDGMVKVCFRFHVMALIIFSALG